MSAGDEATTLRRRMDALESAVASMARRGDCGGTAVVLKVQAISADAPEFVSVKSARVDGDEVEGATPGFALSTEVFVAANVGSKKPPVDTYLVGELIDGYWVVQYDGEEA